MCKVLLVVGFFGIAYSSFSSLVAAAIYVGMECGSPASVTALSMNLPALPTLDRRSSVIVLDNPAFFNGPIKCHLFKNIVTERRQQEAAVISLDIHAKKHITAALQRVFDNPDKLSELLVYLQNKQGLFVALAAPLVAVLVHFFDRYDELLVSFDCVSLAIHNQMSAAFVMLKNGMLQELEKYPDYSEIMPLLGINQTLILQMPDRSDLMAACAEEAANYTTKVETLPVGTRAINSEKAYRLFKKNIANLRGYTTETFQSHWAFYWTQEGLDIFKHHEILIRGLCEMWLALIRQDAYKSPLLVLHDSRLTRLCEAINHEAQNVAVDRSVRLALSTESLMRYVERYLGRHKHKEYFKVFLRMNTYSQDYIRPL